MKWSHVLKFHWNSKDGGPESRSSVWGVESKLFGSVLLVRFGKGSRNAFHSHAFNSRSWVLFGALHELHIQGHIDWHFPSWRPVITLRKTYHKVSGLYPTNWVLTLRGPWVDTWREFHPATNRAITLTHGRKEI